MDFLLAMHLKDKSKPYQPNTKHRLNFIRARSEYHRFLNDVKRRPTEVYIGFATNQKSWSFIQRWRCQVYYKVVHGSHETETEI